MSKVEVSSDFYKFFFHENQWTKNKRIIFLKQFDFRKSLGWKTWLWIRQRKNKNNKDINNFKNLFRNVNLRYVLWEYCGMFFISPQLSSLFLFRVVFSSPLHLLLFSLTFRGPLYTQGCYDQGSYIQGLLQLWVLQSGILTTRGLTIRRLRGLTSRGSYNQESNVQGFLRSGVLRSGVLT